MFYWSCLLHRWRKEALTGGGGGGGGGQTLTIARENFGGHAPLIEVQRSLVSIGGPVTVRNKEMVENVHCDRFLKLF